MKLMNRDQNIISLLNTVKVLDTSTITNLFFNGSLRSCQKRLSILNECGYIKRFRDNVWSQYIYYIGHKPKQWSHDMYVGKLLSYLKQHDIEVMKVKGSSKIGNIITDSIIVIRINNTIKFLLVEIELHPRIETVNKYKDLYRNNKYKDYGFNIEPKVLLITNSNKIYNSLNYQLIKTDLDFTDLIHKI